MRMQISLTPDSSAPSLAREHVARLGTAVPDETLEDLRLLVSELVTNGVKHAGLSPNERIELNVRSRNHRVEGRIRYPEHRGFASWLSVAPGPGHGLHVVDEIAKHWSVVITADWVEAWFELRVPPGA